MELSERASQSQSFFQKHRFVLLYLLFSSVLFTMSEFLIPASVVDALTLALTHIAASMIGLFDAELLHRGHFLLFQTLDRPGLVITEECSGLTFSFLIVAAVFAYDATAKEKYIGLLVLLLLVQVMNIVRIVSLFLVMRWFPDQFHWFHVSLWPLMAAVITVLLFLGWVEYLRRRAAIE